MFRIVVCITLFFCSCSTTSEPPKHFLGGLYNLTGEQDSIDIPSVNGAKLAAEELKKKFPELDLIIENGASDPSVITQKAHSLSQKPEVSALFGLSDTNMVIAAAPEAIQAKKVFLTSGATSPLLPKQFPTYLYLVAFGDNAQAAAAAEFARSSLGAKTACLLYDGEMEYTQLLARYFKESFSTIGGKIVFEKSFPHAATDITAILQQIYTLSSPPDLIYLATEPEQAPALIRQIRSQGFRQPIFGGDSFDTALVKSDPELINNIYFTTHIFLDPHSDDPLITNFIEAYQTKYGTPPSSAFAALGYDAVHLLFHVAKEAGSLEPEAILQELATTQDFPAITGPISYSKGNSVPVKPVTIVVCRNGSKASIARFIPRSVPPP